MVRQTLCETPADFAKAQGWGVGTRIVGAPILHDGKLIEGMQSWKISAIGEEYVLALTSFDDIGNYRRESPVTFSCREWEIDSSDSAEMECDNGCCTPGCSARWMKPCCGWCCHD